MVAGQIKPPPGVMDRVSEAAPWQYLQENTEAQVIGGVIEPTESKRRRNIRRKNQASKVERAMIAAKNERDANGFLKMPRIEWCGSARFGAGSVELDIDTDGIGHLSKLSYCNHILTCPICSEIIRHNRADEISRGVRTHLENGGGVLFMTLTLSHHKGDRLNNLNEILRKAFPNMRSRAPWKRFSKSLYYGYISSYENPYGENGWHPHRHVMLLTTRGLDDTELALLRDELKASWVEAVQATGGNASFEHGLDLQKANTAEAIANYIVKEIVNEGDTKHGKGSRTPFQLLDEDTEQSRRLWAEHVEASHNQRAIVWTRGLKKKLGVIDKTDAEITAEHDAMVREIINSANIDKDVYNPIHNDAVTVEQVIEAVKAEDYDHAALIMGCGWYPRFIEKPGGELDMNPMFTRYLDTVGKEA